MQIADSTATSRRCASHELHTHLGLALKTHAELVRQVEAASSAAPGWMQPPASENSRR